MLPPLVLPEMPKRSITVSVDPITLIIDECVVISLAMRKMSRWSQSGVAAILGAGDLFGEDSLGVESMGTRANGSSLAPNSNPLHSSFLQLRAILTETADVEKVDSLTVLQPFLMAIESSTTSGKVTAMALEAVTKFLDYGIVSFHLKNLQGLLIQLVSSLTHCRFEASDQNTDDSVLLKVLRLLEKIIDLNLLSLLPNAVVSEVIQTCLSLACNKRRSEVLRRAAEMAMVSMTVRIFLRLKELEPNIAHSEDILTNYAALPADVIGGTSAEDAPTPSAPEMASPRKLSQTPEKQFDIECITEFLGILISMISPSNQYQHMESTRVFALSLIHTAIEVAGEDIPKHPSLFGLVADPISKDVLQIITTTDSPPLLLAALRLFCSMAIVLNKYLHAQIELTLNLLFKSILPHEAKHDDSIKGNPTDVTTRIASSKESIVESLSLLWTRSPHFFSQVFVEFDCDFEKTDMATSFVHLLCKLALPESALVATDNVPPICLEGVLSLITGINDRAKQNPKSTQEPHHLIVDKEQKKSFVRCTDIFNENPKAGVAALAEKKFIVDPSDVHELAAFFFNKSTRLNKKVLGEYLAKPSNVDLLKEFMHLFDFTGLRVDEALRLLLKSFRLPGESQQIERIVELFADSYVTCLSEDSKLPPSDPDQEIVRPDRDAVFILSYSIIMLNTDLHNPQVKQQMELDSYKRNLKGVYGGKDFPEWYLAKIYQSIKDREIIMPEEHHGTEKWFDDVWHNLISSQSKAARNSEISVTGFDLATWCQFDKLLFETIVNEIIDTLIKVFMEASDDNIITKLMSSVDKCANICITYGLTEPIEKLISNLSKMTTLTERADLNVIADEYVRSEIPITQIKIESKSEPIIVSELAVHFGRDFKAQLATVVLFRLIKKPECQVSDSWSSVMKIILNLFENCLINPNIFTEFQKKIRLQSLPKVKPRYVIQRMKQLKESGILSTFSSFLKGYSDEPPEPTDQEVESTLSTTDCVKSVNVPAIIENVSRSSRPQLIKFINIVSEIFPEYSEESRRYFETEVMFLFEIQVCFTLIINEPEVTNQVISKLNEFLTSDHLTRRGYIRVCAYLFLLARQSDGSCKESVLNCINHLSSFDKDVISKHGSSLIQTIFSLIDHDSSLNNLVLEESYWKILRVLGSVPSYADEILSLVESIIKDYPEEITETNYVSFLGLLDEISSLGAVGAQLEQTKESSHHGDESKQEANDEATRFLVELSNRSVALTGELGLVHNRQSYALIQALAHQCFNPCREVRSHAIKALQSSLSSTEFNEDFTVSGIYEYGLFPLMAELVKDEVFNTDLNGFPETHLQTLAFISKTFLQYQTLMGAEEKEAIWLQIIDSFVSVNQLNAKYQKGEVREPTQEVMKNMLLVLHEDFLNGSNAKLVEQTWARLEPIYPGMKEALA